MNTPRRHIFKLLGLALAVSAAFPALAHHDDEDGLRSGKVFTSTNSTSGNELLVYAPSSAGALNLLMRVPTQGQGSGAGLGSQGAVTLSGNGRYVFVVNALSNTLTTLAVHEHDLSITSVVNSGGTHPISVTEHDGIVYVLNAQGAGNVTGFRNVKGELQAIPGAVQGLSTTSGANPAQVGFSTDGDALVVTEKGTNKLTTYRVNQHGLISAPLVTASAGQTPFGFAFDRRDHLIVSEAFGGAADASALSSYRFQDWAPAKPIVMSASVRTTQTAACWVAVTPNGKYAYTTNAGSGSISSYRIGRDGQIALTAAVAGNVGAGSTPIDVSVSASGHQLYVLNAGTSSIGSYTVGHDGGLTGYGLVGGLPKGTAGLAAN